MSNEFLNGLQAASNAVAGNVAGPVDILAFLLRKAGMPVPENAIGGSNWMTQKGLMAPVRQGASQVIGETAGLLGPAMVSQFGPQIARGLLKGGENLAAPRTLNPQTGAVVYHGSPHKFDKFDSSKIGTGEGAQAYGHGLYLADEADVALNYAPRDPKFEQKIMGAYKQAEARQLYPVMEVHEAYLLHKTPQEVQKMIDGMEGISAAEKAAVQQAQKFATQQYSKQAGSLYKVDLPDEKIARMLDWDAPLSQQAPEVQKALEPTLRRSIKPYKAVDGSTRYMASVYGQQRPFKSESEALDALSSELDGATAYLLSGEGAQSSNLLARQGIPGIRYLDGSSRTAGQGTRNYVVFPGEESSLRILERNGQGLLGP